MSIAGKILIQDMTFGHIKRARVYLLFSSYIQLICSVNLQTTVPNLKICSQYSKRSWSCWNTFKVSLSSILSLLFYIASFPFSSKLPLNCYLKTWTLLYFADWIILFNESCKPQSMQFCCKFRCKVNILYLTSKTRLFERSNEDNMEGWGLAEVGASHLQFLPKQSVTIWYVSKSWCCAHCSSVILQNLVACG